MTKRKPFKRAEVAKFTPTHLLAYDRGLWIRVVYIPEQGICYNATGTVFNVTPEQLKPLPSPTGA